MPKDIPGAIPWIGRTGASSARLGARRQFIVFRRRGCSWRRCSCPGDPTEVADRKQRTSVLTGAAEEKP